MQSLESISIPDSVLSIGIVTFYNCTSLKTVKLPLSLKSIEKQLFMGCSSLEEVNIHSLSKLETIGEYSFSDCTSLSEVKILPSVKIIELGAFRNCSSLKAVSFDNPSSLKIINFSCFEKCSSLKEIEIPDSVKSIRRFAFKNCEALTDIKIHPSLKIIQPDAFNGCTSLDPNLIPSSIHGLKIPKKDTLPIIKFIILGGFGVGKTTIFKRYINENIDEIDMGFSMNFKSKVITVDGNEVNLHIYDIPGMERTRNTHKIYYRNVNVAILVMRLTDPKTMDRALDYFLDIKKMNSELTAIFLFSKYYSGEDKKLKKSERFIEMENEYQFKCFEVSAHMNENIDESFQYAANEAFYRFIYDEEILKAYEVDDNGKSIDISNQGDSKKRSNC